ncbi:MAG: MarR family winged helix-turn-helix transcriptional regulator [Burkholderiaceae bacterium]
MATAIALVNSRAARQPTLGHLLFGLYRTLQREVYDGLREAGFSEIRDAHSHVLRHIRPEGMRLTSLAAAAGTTKQYMTYLVNDLCALGLLEVLPDPDDGRAKRVRLTEYGQRVYDQAVSISRALERRWARRVGVERMQSLRDVMQTLLTEDTDAMS